MHGGLSNGCRVSDLDSEANGDPTSKDGGTGGSTGLRKKIMLGFKFIGLRYCSYLSRKRSWIFTGIGQVVQ